MRPVILSEEEVVWIAELRERLKIAEANLLKKDNLIKNLEERVKKYMAKYPNGANGCCCLFDDDNELISSCLHHKERESRACPLPESCG
jgi:hypothetical protein